VAAKITGAASFAIRRTSADSLDSKVRATKKTKWSSYLTDTTGTGDTTGTRGITVTIGTLHATYKLMLTMHLS